MQKKVISIFVLIFLFLITAFSFFLLERQDNFSVRQGVSEIKHVQIARQKIKVDLAVSKNEQETGLSGKKDIKKDEGMLFIFDHPDIYSFWMKDMNFPIDIIWVDSSFRVVFIEENLSPESYPQSFSPSSNSQYVLEVYAGFSKENNLKIGEKIEFFPS